MSRIGKQPIAIPKEVKITIEPGLIVCVGKKGMLRLEIPKGISVKLEENVLSVSRDDDTKQFRSLHGTIRVLISNMIDGVTDGFKKELELIGVGYKAQLKGKDLVLNIGFSHPVEMHIPESLKVTVPSPTRIVVEGINKQEVGEFAAKVRRNYPPEPYKGKGIRYLGEEVRRKLGKALAK